VDKVAYWNCQWVSTEEIFGAARKYGYSAARPVVAAFKEFFDRFYIFGQVYFFKHAAQAAFVCIRISLRRICVQVNAEHRFCCRII